MEWTSWNWINVFFAFASGHFAISCWRNGLDTAGHLNAFACVLNSIIVLDKLGF